MTDELELARREREREQKEHSRLKELGREKIEGLLKEVEGLQGQIEALKARGKEMIKERETKIEELE